MRLVRSSCLLLIAVTLSACPEKKEAPAPTPINAEPTPTPTPSTEPGTAEPSAEPQAAAPAVGIGSIEGEVVLNGKPPEMQPLKRGADPVCAKAGEALDEAVVVKDGKLKNAVVRITKNAPAGAAVPKDAVVIDQEQCLYHPRVQAAMRGQPLQIKNSDGTLHNIHTYEGTTTWFNQAQPPKAAPISKVLDRKSVVKLKCDVHPWMTGFIVLSDNPFFATTEGNGKFTLKDVPAGTYTVESWHEKFGVKSQEVTVKADAATTVSFAYAPEDRG